MSVGIKKYAYIDAIRGIAASGVILHHTPREYLSDEINSFLTLGAGGVPLFFILSAFTLFLSFQRRSTVENHPIGNFFIRRFFRIAPLLYVLVFYFLWEYNGNHSGDSSSIIGISTIISTLTFTFGFHPYTINAIVPSSWSVATEMIFYFILPFLFFWVKSLKQALWFLIVAILSSKIILFVVAHYSPASLTEGLYWKDFLYMFFPAQLPVFALGILLYFLIKTKETSDRITEKEALPILILCALLLVNNGLRTFTTDGLIPRYIPDAALLFLPFIFSLYLYPAKLFVNKATIYLGKISYSLYLTHAIVIHWLSRFIPEHLFGYGVGNYLFHFVLIFLLAVPLASVTYYCIEKPGMRLGQMIIEKIESSRRKTPVTL